MIVAVLQHIMWTVFVVCFLGLIALICLLYLRGVKFVRHWWVTPCPVCKGFWGEQCDICHGYGHIWTELDDPFTARQPPH
jgi:hypothetical protein